MVAQRLKPQYFVPYWTDSNYSDKAIIRSSKHFPNGDNSVDNDLNMAYQAYYWPYVNNTGHNFDDYDYIFNSKHSIKGVANCVIYHLMMRFYYYYFRAQFNNGKYRNSKQKQRKYSAPIVAGILHDKDKNIIISKPGVEDIKKVSPHIHVIFRLSKQVTPPQMSHWVGTGSQYFQTGQKGRYAFQNSVSYLTHSKQPGKHFYSYKRVISSWNFDYKDYYLRHSAEWAEYRANSKTKENRIDSNRLAHDIQLGRINKMQILLDDDLYSIYADNMKKINDAVASYDERVGAKTWQALIHRRFKLSTFYIYGSGGSGKTYLAKKLCHELRDKYGWNYYTTAGTNAFDNYSGEPVVLMDDIRPSSLNPQDWLKLMDPLMISPMSARYHNQTVSARVIIITNTDPMRTFFGFMPGVHGNEPMSQFIRRITSTVKVINTSANNRKYFYSSVRKLPVPIKINVSKDKDDKSVYKKTRYVPYYLEEYTDANGATEHLLKIIANNNNPKVPHKISDRKRTTEGFYRSNSKYFKLAANNFSPGYNVINYQSNYDTDSKRPNYHLTVPQKYGITKSKKLLTPKQSWHFKALLRTMLHFRRKCLGHVTYYCRYGVAYFNKGNPIFVPYSVSIIKKCVGIFLYNKYVNNNACKNFYDLGYQFFHYYLMTGKVFLDPTKMKYLPYNPFEFPNPSLF